MLQKQTVDISFAQGLDLKTDPKRVAIGKFLNLENSVFTKQGLLQKRNGFPSLTTLPTTDTTFLTTFNDDLTAIGTNIYAYSIPTVSWIDKATLYPCELSVLTLIRSNTNQSQADSVVAANGLVCTVYTDQNIAALETNVYKYVVADSNTGQNIIEPTLLPSADVTYGTPRVFLLSSGYFVILYTTKVVSTYHLTYLAVSTNNPAVTVGPRDIAVGYGPSTSLAFDGYTLGEKLFIAYNELSGGGSVNVTYLQNVATGPVTPHAFTGFAGEVFSVTADNTSPQNPTIYITFVDQGATNTYVAAVDQNLNVILAPYSVSAAIYPNVATSAINGVLSLFFENTNFYPDGVTPTNFISTMTLSDASTTPILSSITVLKRSVGLASKAFLFNGVTYMLVVYNSVYQPTFFLMDGSGDIIAKFAYSNGGSLNLNVSNEAGYLPTGLPNTTLTNNLVQIAYLVKDSVTAVNKNIGGINEVAGLYAQAGINLINITIGTSSVSASEAATTLNLSGGFVWSYDGYVAVEQNFFVWPDYVTATYNANSTVTPTGNSVSGSVVLGSISATTGIFPGMTITGTDIQADTTVVAVLSGSSIQISLPATGTASGTTFTIQGNVAAQPNGSTNTNAYYYQVIYSWSDNQGNRNVSAPSIPVALTTTGSGTNGSVTLNIDTLRLTYKTANPVKIEVYRWSVAQEVYYQVTSIELPLLNDTTVDYVTFTDTQSDADILGNEIIYTTGGVVEDISPPATSLMTLFQSRLWVVDAEDPNLLWFSKQIIESTPIEMSDLFTFYVSPTIGAQGSTGYITALAPMDDKLILFKLSGNGTAIYYINGTGPDNTGANNQFSEPIFVGSTIGCNNQQSIVFIPQGLMFQSDKGIWLLGRDLSTSYIGAPVETLTTGATVMTAVNIPGTTQVRFTMSTGITLMYDYFFSAWGIFTLNGISSTLFQGLHTYVNDLGQVFQESPGTYLDGTNPVLMSFTTSWISLAGLQGFERFYQCYLLGSYETPFKLNVQFAYDYNPSPVESQVVTPQQYEPNWGGDPLYGANPYWGGISQVFSERVFPTKEKCETFSLTVNEVYDASFGAPAGAGLTLSGLNLVIGVKRAFRTQSAGKSF
jgi:hypothetical protein